MKRFCVVLVLLAGLFLVGCESSPPQYSPDSSWSEAVLKGEHSLRKMTENTEVNSKISGSFFFLVGGFDGSTKTEMSVKFAWQMNDGTYAISSLPLEKIRVKFDEKATMPRIKFRWLRYGYNREPQTQDLMDCYVLYAVVTVRESDWPIQVNLPLNKTQPYEKSSE